MLLGGEEVVSDKEKTRRSRNENVKIMLKRILI